jgi:hypothetical protein
MLIKLSKVRHESRMNLKHIIPLINPMQTDGVLVRPVADEAALNSIATRIAPKFGASAEVIAKRLRVKKLWPPN